MHVCVYRAYERVFNGTTSGMCLSLYEAQVAERCRRQLHPNLKSQFRSSCLPRERLVAHSYCIAFSKCKANACGAFNVSCFCLWSSTLP